MLHSCPAGAIAPGVLVRLVVPGAGEVVDAAALRVRHLRQVRRPRHPERTQQPLVDQRPPVLTPDACDHLAEQGEPEVAVVERDARLEHPAAAVVRGDQLGRGDTGRPLPPRANRLGLHAGGVGQQLADSGVPIAALRHMGAQRVVQVEPALVTALHHQHRRERLGDRPDPVLLVEVRDVPCGACPGERTPPGRRPRRSRAAARRPAPGRGRPASARDPAPSSARPQAKASGGGQEQTRLRSP